MLFNTIFATIQIYDYAVNLVFSIDLNREDASLVAAYQTTLFLVTVYNCNRFE
jgi:hypothetical protein